VKASEALNCAGAKARAREILQNFLARVKPEAMQFFGAAVRAPDLPEGDNPACQQISFRIAIGLG
jgi:hypothetical protein